MSQAARFEVELPGAGLQMHGLRAGRGEPVLLLHGWPEWSHAWRPVMSRLAHHFELVAPDLRGFGDTLPAGTTPSREAGPERHADDLIELANSLGWARFSIVSHDVGSFVAQALARRVPQRIRALYFFNGAYPGIGQRWAAPGHLGEIWYQSFHRQPWAAEMVGASRGACRLYLGHFLRHWSHQQAWVAGELEHWVDQFMKPGRLQGGFNWYASVHEARMAVIEGRAPALAPIGLPTRVLWGAHDPVLKLEWADRLHEYFDPLHLAVQADAGHFVHQEQPDAAAADIQGFFGA